MRKTEELVVVTKTYGLVCRERHRIVLTPRDKDLFPVLGLVVTTRSLAYTCQL